MTADPRDLEPIAARAWRAAESAQLGGWALHASSGYSGRINACWPLAPPGLPLADAVSAVEAWYAARSLPPVFKIVPETAKGLPDHLAAIGYHARTATLMMVGPTTGEADAGVRVAAELDPAFEAVFAAAGTGEAGDTLERLQALARVAPPCGFALLDVAGEPAAIGACAIEGDWVGVFAMRTAAAHRRKGYGRRVFASLLAAARAAGASRGYLQVEADNAPAIALYAAAGYAEAYRYAYWSRD